MLVDAPETVELSVSRIVVIKRPAEKKVAPMLTVDGVAGEVSVGSNLRTACMDSGHELYVGLMAKMNQCGGAGQCSACWVNVLEGGENLSPKTPVEEKKGAKRPEGYRMACQALVNGDVK